jgi:hypothetical protein
VSVVLLYPALVLLEQSNCIDRIQFCYLRIDRNFCLVHEEITSIRLYTPCTQGCVHTDWGYFEWTEQIISINPYISTQTFFDMILKNIFIWFKKVRLFANERNLKIDVVLKASPAIVIGWFSINEAPLGLFKFISY